MLRIFQSAQAIPACVVNVVSARTLPIAGNANGTSKAMAGDTGVRIGTDHKFAAPPEKGTSQVLQVAGVGGLQREPHRQRPGRIAERERVVARRGVGQAVHVAERVAVLGSKVSRAVEIAVPGVDQRTGESSLRCGEA